MTVRPRLPAILLALAPLPALAQPAEKPARTVDEVVVTAAKPAEVRSSIDRRSYDAASNVQAAAGTLADLLRTLPSVDVDPQGNVTLRGDPGVVITIDGKRSGMFVGEGRAQTIQSLPADQFERVEVITNPSAAESAEGGAGIINLVSKTTRKAGVSGSARASLGTFGQYATGLSAGYNTAKLGLTGEVSYRGGDPQRFISVDARRETLSDGLEQHRLISTAYRGFGRIFTSRLGADYDLDEGTRLGAQLRYTVTSGSQPGFERLEDRDSLGRLALSVRDIGRSPFWNDDTEGSLGFRRKLGDDQEVTADLRQERATYQFGRPDRTSRIEPPEADIFTRFDTRMILNTTGAKVNYQRIRPEGDEIKSGYELRIEDNSYWSVIARGPAADALSVVPGLTGGFAYRLEVQAAFATWQRKWADLTVLGGLRLEAARTTVAAPGEPAVATSRLRPYPSLHAGYGLDEERRLSASYSRRVTRPPPFYLSPVVSYQNERAIYRGDPTLRPAETDSFELGYERRREGANLTATLFLREIHGELTTVTRDLGDGVLVFTPANLDGSRRAGGSLSWSRKLSPTVNTSVSGDLYYSRIRGDGGLLRSGLAGAGRASISWQATPDDLLQADVRATSRAQTPQGRRTGSTIVNLGYRRRLTPSLFAVVSARNVFDSADLAEVVDEPGLSFRRNYRGLPAAVTFGLTYNFGGARKPPEFEFGGP